MNYHRPQLYNCAGAEGGGENVPNCRFTISIEGNLDVRIKICCQIETIPFNVDFVWRFFIDIITTEEDTISSGGRCF